MAEIKEFHYHPGFVITKYNIKSINMINNLTSDVISSINIYSELEYSLFFNLPYVFEVSSDKGAEDIDLLDIRGTKL
jgi:hypothetical protein